MSFKKIILYTGLAAIIGLSTVAVAPDADAARIRSRGNGSVNENDVKAVNAYTDAFEKFLNDLATKDTGETPNLPSYETLQSSNDALQSHGFRDLNDDYKKATGAIKAKANTITEKAGAVNSAPFATPSQTIRDFNSEMRSYNDLLPAMTDAAEKFRTERTDSSNQIFGYIMAGVGVLVAAAVIWGIIVSRKRSAKSHAVLFGNDPAAAMIPAKDKKMLIAVHKSLLKYETYYKKGDKTSMDVTRQVGYTPYETSAAQESLGRYRSLIFEFAALIALAHNNNDHAKAMLDRAEGYLGSREFYTETARNFQN